MTSNSQKKNLGPRSRAPNYTREEQEILAKIIETYIPIIESKKTDSIKLSEKQRAWAKITDIYNANTTQSCRSTDNLVSCYRNMKSKVKKQRSEAKMQLRDPSHKEALIAAIEEHGKDWPTVSKHTNVPIEFCKLGLVELQQQTKQTDIDYKKKVMGTGGGPPPSDDDPLLTRIKTIIEPQIEGLYTVYDGDSELMAQFQESIPENDRIHPIESDFLKRNEFLPITDAEEDVVCTAINQEIFTKDADHCDLSETPHVSRNRTDILRKKLHTALNVGKSEKILNSKKTTNDSFARLVEDKIKLTKLNQEVAAAELKERKLNIELKEIEITHVKKLQSIELENLYNEKIFKEEMRRIELCQMNIKTKKMNE